MLAQSGVVVASVPGCTSPLRPFVDRRSAATAELPDEEDANVELGSGPWSGRGGRRAEVGIVVG